MESSTFVQAIPHRGVRSKHTSTLSVILLSFALAVALPATTRAMSTFNFAIEFNSTNTIMGSFTSNKSDLWGIGDILTMQFTVPTDINGPADFFTVPGFDSTNLTHSLLSFKGDQNNGITSLSAEITDGQITDFWGWATEGCLLSSSTQCIQARRREPTGGRGGRQQNSFPVSANITPAAVPEPATIALFGSGLLGLAGYRWHQRRREGTQVG